MLIDMSNRRRADGAIVSGDRRFSLLIGIRAG
jgi:hypothetical protein